MQNSLVPYTPCDLPIRLPIKGQLGTLLKQAKTALAQFDTLLKETPSSADLCTQLTTQEANDSLFDQSSHHNRQPIADYLATFELAKIRLAKHTLSHSDLFALHASMQNLPKRILHYRRLQNWIGPEGRPKELAYFLPPEPKSVWRHMSNLTAYWKRQEKEPLIQLAIIFAQLLIIHPFLDGNGRLARLLIPFFLFQKGCTSQPLFFLSGYFKRHRLAYFQNLYKITAEKQWKPWIVFFLKGIQEQSRLLKKTEKR